MGTQDRQCPFLPGMPVMWSAQEKDQGAMLSEDATTLGLSLCDRTHLLMFTLGFRGLINSRVYVRAWPRQGPQCLRLLGVTKPFPGPHVDVDSVQKMSMVMCLQPESAPLQKPPPRPIKPATFFSCIQQTTSSTQMAKRLSSPYN